MVIANDSRYYGWTYHIYPYALLIIINGNYCDDFNTHLIIIYCYAQMTGSSHGTEVWITNSLVTQTPASQ